MDRCESGRVCQGAARSRATAQLRGTEHTFIGLYKAEEIEANRPWRCLEDVEFATASWVEWFNNRRLFTPIGDIPPAEYEEMYYRHQ